MSAPLISAPPAPVRLEDLGLEVTFARDLMLKTMFRMSLSMPTELARTCGVMPSIIDALIDVARTQNLIETLGNRGPPHHPSCAIS